MEITVILHETVMTKSDFKSVINLEFGKLINYPFVIHLVLG